MKLSLKALVTTFVMGLTFTSVSHAQDARGGFFFEPGISYEFGDVKAKTSSLVGGIPDDSTGEANGFGALARVGFHINDTFFVAADGRYSFLKHELSLYDGESDAKSWMLSPVVGVQMPTLLGLRVWAGYVAAAELDPERAGDWDIKYEKGQGFLVGGGIRLGVVSLNLEYKNVQYDRMVLQANPTGFGNGDTDVEGEDRALMASVSFPFAF